LKPVPGYERLIKYFVWLLQDIIYHAYQRAVLAGKADPLQESNYEKLFTVGMPDISRRDNVNLAKSARDLTLALKDAAALLPGDSETFGRLMLQLTYKFLGEPQDDETIDQMMMEAEESQEEGENATN